MKATVHVSLKPGVLDPEGRAVADTLGRMGFSEVADARMARVIELELDDALTREAAEARVVEMCRQLLANTVIERYRVELDQS